MRWSVGWLFFVLMMGQMMDVQYVGGTRLTVEIDSGREECFYLQAEAGQFLTADYVVLSVSRGLMNVNFQLVDPKGIPVLTEFKKTKSSHKIRINNSGAYAACFDNTFTSFSEKYVTFTLALDVDRNKPEWSNYNSKNLQTEGEYEMHISDIKEAINRVRIQLNDINNFQDAYKDMETRDRSTAENNFERVNFWSMINITVMLTVGLLQVVTLKSLFDPKYNILQIWRKIKQRI